MGAGLIALTALVGGIVGVVTAGLLEYDTPRELWTAAERRFHLRARGRFLGAYLAAVALHATWDSVGSLVGYAVLRR